MIRLIVRTDDAAMAIHCGGAVDTSYRTFDVELPEVETFIRERSGNPDWKYTQRQLVGVELIR